MSALSYKGEPKDGAWVWGYVVNITLRLTLKSQWRVLSEWLRRGSLLRISLIVWSPLPRGKYRISKCQNTDACYLRRESHSWGSCFCDCCYACSDGVLFRLGLDSLVHHNPASPKTRPAHGRLVSFPAPAVESAAGLCRFTHSSP